MRETEWEDVHFHSVTLRTSRRYQFVITRCTSDIHGLEIASLYHGNGQSASSGQVAERKHQIAEVHVILKDNTKQILLKDFS